MDRRRRTKGERYPSRRLSSIGGVTTGWRSSLETRPRQRLGSWIAELLVAAGVIVLIALALVALSPT